MELSTNYLGMSLPHPLVPSASPLTCSLDSARRLEDAGAAALVMYSLFEEEVRREEETEERLLHQEIGNAEAERFLPLSGELPGALERYLEQLTRLKETVSIPVVASLNGTHRDTWLTFGRELETAGADALELNVYYVAADPDLSGAAVEARYVELLQALRNTVSLPINMKLSPQFSSVAHMVRRLEAAGASGVALFNRFYQPDIDLESLKPAPQLHLSRSADALLAMRWIGILHGRVGLTLGATGGIHTAEDAVKMVLAGADVVHLCSTLLQNGPEQLSRILRGMERWLEESPFDSLEQCRGTLSQQHAADPAAYERANYVRTLGSYPAPGAG